MSGIKRNIIDLYGIRQLEPQIDSVSITFRPTNREQKRKMLAEFKRNAIKIAKLEHLFLSQLFEDNIDYSVLFWHYSRQYDEVFKTLESAWTKPDKHYFYKKFYPIEKL